MLIVSNHHLLAISKFILASGLIDYTGKGTLIHLH